MFSFLKRLKFDRRLIYIPAAAIALGPYLYAFFKKDSEKGLLNNFNKFSFIE